jgi:hypothetical protein
MVTPYLHLSAGFLKSYGQPAKQLANLLDRKWRTIKEATPNDSDDVEKIIVEDSHGRAALKLTFESDGSINLWSARTGSSIGYFDGKVIDQKRKEVAQTIVDWADKAGDGMVRCNECGRWVNIYQTYSYTGAVCNDCFNPKKHRAPDSSG